MPALLASMPSSTDGGGLPFDLRGCDLSELTVKMMVSELRRRGVCMPRRDAAPKPKRAIVEALLLASIEEKGY